MNRAWLLLALCFAMLAVSRSVCAAPIQGITEGVAGFVGMAETGPLDQPVWITSYSAFSATFGSSTVGLSNPWLAPSVAAFFSSGGHQLYVVRVAADDFNTVAGTPGGGLNALLDVDAVSIVALPGMSSAAIQSAAIAHCERAGDRVVLLDPASTDDVGSVLAHRAELFDATGHGALYFPWVQASPTGTSMLLPPSGFAAGICADVGTPNSPVGILPAATAVNYTVTTAEQELLVPAGINPIRDFGTSGIRIWGARTLADDPQWIYLAARRSALYVRESVSEGTAWALSEPNDFVLWAQLESDIDDFLLGLFQLGWFAGSTSAESYYATVNSTTMTQADLDAGRTVMQLGIAPTRPSEFLPLSVVQQRPSVTAAPAVGRSGVRLYGACPNPFNPRTTIRFDLDRPARIDLRIYDLAGRRIRVLRDGDQMPAGPGEVIWDGRTDDGRRVASGSWICRIEADGVVRTRRLTLLK